MMNMTSKTWSPTFLKWAGGKTQLLGQFTKFFPPRIDRYFEPFLGSGAVFFFLRKSLYNPQKIMLSDTNEELIRSFEFVRDNPKELMSLLKNHKENHSEDYYYEIRALEPSELPKIEAAARFIYLNKTCFNGLYRVNSKGKFNVPFGQYKNPRILNEKNLKQASALLRDVELKVQSFEKITRSVKKGDFVYFDPPYMPLSDTANFTTYTKENFLEKEQKKLAEVFRKLDKKGALVMLSNSNTAFIRNLYKDFRIEEVSAARFINCDSEGRGKIKELVILNY